MRWAASCLVLLLLAAPASAQYNQAPAIPRECVRLVKQVVRYQGDVRMAEERNNELWKNFTEQHIERLETRLERRCPGVTQRPRYWPKIFASLIDIAADVAWKYYTYGL